MLFSDKTSPGHLEAACECSPARRCPWCPTPPSPTISTRRSVAANIDELKDFVSLFFDNNEKGNKVKNGIFNVSLPSVSFSVVPIYYRLLIFTRSNSIFLKLCEAREGNYSFSSVLFFENKSKCRNDRSDIRWMNQDFVFRFG